MITLQPTATLYTIILCCVMTIVFVIAWTSLVEFWRPLKEWEKNAQKYILNGLSWLVLTALVLSIIIPQFL